MAGRQWSEVGWGMPARAWHGSEDHITPDAIIHRTTRRASGGYGILLLANVHTDDTDDVNGQSARTASVLAPATIFDTVPAVLASVVGDGLL